MKTTIIILSLLYYCQVADAQIVTDQRQVSNKEWSVFLQSVKADPTLKRRYASSMIPDNWSTTSTNPKNRNNPVVGVSWQQALAYCEWRSVVDTYLYTHSNINSYKAMQTTNMSSKMHVAYRLPNETEWKILTARSNKSDNPGTGFRCVRSVKKLA